MKQVPCPECDREIVNLNRHLVAVHAWTQERVQKRKKGIEAMAGKKKRDYGGKKECGLCGTVVLRMDLHLQRTHKLGKGDAAFATALGKATPFDPLKAGRTDLEKAIAGYTSNIDDRTTGKMKSAQTAAQHATAIRTFLTTLSKESLEALGNVGKRDGLVNEMLESQR